MDLDLSRYRLGSRQPLSVYLTAVLGEGYLDHTFLGLEHLNTNLGWGILDPALPDEPVHILIDEDLLVGLIQNVLLGRDLEILDHIAIVILWLHVLGNEFLELSDRRWSTLRAWSPLCPTQGNSIDTFLDFFCQIDPLHYYELFCGLRIKSSVYPVSSDVAWGGGRTSCRSAA